MYDVNPTAGQSGDPLSRQRLHGDEAVLLGGGAVCGVRGHGGGGGAGGGASAGCHGLLLVAVGLYVLGQVVTAHESLWTDRARELLLS